MHQADKSHLVFVTYTVMPFVLFGTLSMGIKLGQRVGKGLVRLFTARDEDYDDHRAEEELEGHQRMSNLKFAQWC